MNSYILGTIFILYLARSNVNALMCYQCKSTNPLDCADLIVGHENYTHLLRNCKKTDTQCKFSQVASTHAVGAIYTKRECVADDKPCSYKNTFYACCYCRRLGCNGNSLCNAVVPSKAVGTYNKLRAIVLVSLGNIMAALN